MKIQFLNGEIENKIETLGYATLPLIEEKEIKELLEIYNQIATVDKAEKAKLFVSSRDCDYETSLLISSRIQDILLTSFQKAAKYFSLYGGAFIVKEKNDSNEFSLHQDFTLVNPEKNQTLAVWIALQDISENNGAMFLVEKSHLIRKSYISASYNNARIERKNINPKYIKTIALKAGEALLFSDNIFHGSFNNLSDTKRVAVTARITDKEAPFVYYHKINNHTAGMYSIQPHDLIKYFREFQEGEIPEEIKLKETIPYKHLSLNHKILNRELNKINGNEDGIISKLKRMFT